MHKEAGRPIPPFSDDPVLDFMVTEAIAIKVLQEDREAQEKQQAEDEKNRWKKDVDHLKQFQ